VGSGLENAPDGSVVLIYPMPLLQLLGLRHRRYTALCVSAWQLPNLRDALREGPAEGPSPTLPAQASHGGVADNRRVCRSLSTLTASTGATLASSSFHHCGFCAFARRLLCLLGAFTWSCSSSVPPERAPAESSPYTLALAAAHSACLSSEELP